MKRKPRHVASRAIEFCPRRFFFVALRETQRLSLHGKQPDDRREDGGGDGGLRFPATPGIQYVSLDSHLTPPGNDSSELQRTVRFCNFLAGFLNDSPSGSCFDRISDITSRGQHSRSSTGQVYYFYLRRWNEDAEMQAIHLICRWRLLHLQLSPQEAVVPFEHLEFLFPSVSSLRFGFSSPSPSSSHPNLLVSLLGIAKGLEMELMGSGLDDLRLHVDQHKDLGSLENGDMTWITKRLLVFAGQDPEPAPDAADSATETTPSDQEAQSQSQIQARLTTKSLAPLLNQQQVALVIHLSRQSCEESQFAENGMEVVDLSSPPLAASSQEEGKVRPPFVNDSVLLRFLDTCESTTGIVAIHSSAGSGRAALYVGCYLMKHLQFTSQEAFGWLHLCCSSNLTPMHRLALDRLQLRMWRDGDAFRRLVVYEASATAAVHPTASSASAMDEFLKTSGSLQINIGNISLGRSSLFGTKPTNAGGHSGPRILNSSRELPIIPTTPGDGDGHHHYQYQPHHPQQPSSSSSANANVVPQHLKRRPLTQGSNGRRPRLQSFYRNGEGGDGGMLRADFAQMHKFLHQTGSSVVATPRSASGNAATNEASVVSSSDGHLPSVHIRETGRRSSAVTTEIQQ